MLYSGKLDKVNNSTPVVHIENKKLIAISKNPQFCEMSILVDGIKRRP